MTPPEAAVKAEIVPPRGGRPSLTNQPERRSNGGDGHRGVTHRNVASGVGGISVGEWRKEGGINDREEKKEDDRKEGSTGLLKESEIEKEREKDT